MVLCSPACIHVQQQFKSIFCSARKGEVAQTQCFKFYSSRLLPRWARRGQDCPSREGAHHAFVEGWSQWKLKELTASATSIILTYPSPAVTGTVSRNDVHHGHSQHEVRDMVSGHSDDASVVGLDDSSGHFQPWWFYDTLKYFIKKSLQCPWKP